MPNPAPNLLTATAPQLRRHLLSGLDHCVYCWPKVAEPNGAPPFLLLHGWLDQAQSFAGLAQHLRQYADVFALDFRGHGGSEWIGKGGYYHFADYLRDIDDLWRAIPELAQGCVVIGHSMGGTIATYTAATFPASVVALVALEGIGPPGRQPESMPSRVKKWLADLHKLQAGPRYFADIDAAAARVRLTYPEFSEQEVAHFTQRAIVATEHGWRWHYDPLHLSASPQPFLAATFMAFAAAVKQPILLMRGQISPMSGIDNSDAERRIAAYAGPREMITIPDAAHMMHITHANVVAQAVEGWLARSSKPSVGAAEG